MAVEGRGREGGERGVGARRKRLESDADRGQCPQPETRGIDRDALLSLLLSLLRIDVCLCAYVL